VRRRDFITLLGFAAAWPVAARAQPPMPVVGYLSVGAPPAHLLAVFKQSLAQAGFVEGRNVAIETPSADGHYDRLPALAADLVRRQVAVIVVTANPALAAKEATATIPIVFNVPEDPVGLGLVASLARPGGNATSVSFLFSDLAAKHLGLLRELLPRAGRIGLLVNPQNANVDILTKNATAAAASLSAGRATLARSKTLSRRWRGSERMLSWSAQMGISFADEYSSQRWWLATVFPPSAPRVSTPRLEA
jgi:putative tryptophan/tyrosine transport system substrate-binding protein